MMRRLLAASATLLLAVPALAVIKTYNVDADNSTRFPTDRTIFRGDCDPNGASPNSGDLANDLCTCDPTIPLDLAGGCGEGVNTSCTSLTTPGRPNGGACDPAIPNGPGASGFCFGGGTWRGDACTVGSEATNCPAQGNSVCTGSMTPLSCCTGVGTGTCAIAQGTCRTGGCPLGLNVKSSNASCSNTLPNAKAVINDAGGAPTLVSLDIIAAFTDIVGGTTTTGIPGTTVYLDNLITLGPADNQVGSGNTTSSINFGNLTGWAQTGRLGCVTFCPPGGVCKTSACTPFGVLAGTGPPAALASSSFNLDPWTFTGGGVEFSTGNVETTFLPPGVGAVRANLAIGGRLISVPALPLAGVAGLGAGLVYLGARALRRKDD
jgi:hypothetical protein